MRSGADGPAIEDVSPVGERQHEVEVVLDDQDRHVLAQLLQRPVNLLALGRR